METIGFPELLVILGVAVLLFGGKKIPEVAKGLGEGIRNFKTSLKGEEEKVEEKKQAEASRKRPHAGRIFIAASQISTNQPRVARMGTRGFIFLGGAAGAEWALTEKTP